MFTHFLPDMANCLTPSLVDGVVGYHVVSSGALVIIDKHLMRLHRVSYLVVYDSMLKHWEIRRPRVRVSLWTGQCHSFWHPQVLQLLGL